MYPLGLQRYAWGHRGISRPSNYAKNLVNELRANVVRLSIEFGVTPIKVKIADAEHSCVPSDAGATGHPTALAEVVEAIPTDSSGERERWCYFLKDAPHLFRIH